MYHDGLGKNFPMVPFLYLVQRHRAIYFSFFFFSWAVQRGWEVSLCKTLNNPCPCLNKGN